MRFKDRPNHAEQITSLTQLHVQCKTAHALEQERPGLVKHDLLPCDGLGSGLACSSTKETGNEAIEVFGRGDHRDFEGVAGQDFGWRSLPQARHW
ncbi:hypothetical protein HOE425_333328 [Hoeflea sp. EC-HK425]|nr:hypothetical protein HOE425_333328 [Hoeflea sp. EC-HK425]